jgi:hypothetical protein
MANAFQPSSNAWLCTETGALTTERVKVRSWRWTGATAAAQQMIIKDAAGGIFAKAIADGANYNDEQLFVPGAWVNGLTIDTLGGGVVVIVLA